MRHTLRELGEWSPIFSPPLETGHGRLSSLFYIRRIASEITRVFQQTLDLAYALLNSELSTQLRRTFGTIRSWTIFQFLHTLKSSIALARFSFISDKASLFRDAYIKPLRNQRVPVPPFRPSTRCSSSPIVLNCFQYVQ